jgi:hypothetical protein
VLLVLLRFTRWFFQRYGERVSEPEIKYLLIVLFALGALAKEAGREAVLPARAVRKQAQAVARDSHSLLEAGRETTGRR